MSELEYRFIDNPNAPEVICHHLHDVHFNDGMAEFILIKKRKSRSGELLGEQCASVFLPVISVEPAIVLTWSKLPSGVIVPALGRLVKKALWVN